MIAPKLRWRSWQLCDSSTRHQLIGRLAEPVGAGRDRALERFLIERQTHDAAEQVRELQIIRRYPAEKDSALGACTRACAR